MEFLQKADYCTKLPVTQNLSDHFLHAIHEYTNLSYFCTKTASGYFLEPLFRHTLWRNSFMPEITVSICQDADRDHLHIEGQPVKSVRIFVSICFWGSLAMALFSLVAALISDGTEAGCAIIPLVIAIYSFFLCTLATTATFHNVVNAIKKEFPQEGI